MQEFQVERKYGALRLVRSGGVDLALDGSDRTNMMRTGWWFSERLKKTHQQAINKSHVYLH